jgi:hypothetical protein
MRGVFFGLSLLLAATVASAQSESAAAPPTSVAVSAATEVAGAPLKADDVFRAWLDRTDLGRMIRRDATKLRVQKASDGTEMLALGEGFRDVFIATIDENGKAVLTCVATVEGARSILAVVPALRVREP